MTSNAALSGAERAFKQKQKEAETAEVWRDLAAHNAHVEQNTARLRALRLAREAQIGGEKKKVKGSAAHLP